MHPKDPSVLKILRVVNLLHIAIALCFQQAPNPPEFAQPRLSRAEWHRSKTPKFVASHLGNLEEGRRPPTQDKIQHLDFTKDAQPLYNKTPPCVFYHKNVRSKAVFGP